MGERDAAQLREHYEVEKALASQLRAASREVRRGLYSSLYNELFRRVPHHPQVTRKASPEEARAHADRQLRLLRPFLRPGHVYLEIGPGDCALAFAAARFVKQAYAVDVSEEITRLSSAPANFKLVLSDGCSIPVPPASVDVAFSSDLIEHLHPDDAEEQLRNIQAALAPGGMYVCVTPSRLSGPWDISMHFDSVATGFHLKEYTVRELSALFRKAGFARVDVLAGRRENYFRMPAWPIIILERLVDLLPYRMRKAVSMRLNMACLKYIRMVGVK